MKDLDAYFDREPLPDLAFAPDAGYPIFNIEMGSMNVVFSGLRSKEEIINKPLLPLIKLVGGSTLTLVPDKCTALLSLAHLNATQVEQLRFHVANQINISAAICEVTELELELTAGNEFIEGSPTGSRNAIANMITCLIQFQMDTGMNAFLQFLHEKIGSQTDGQSLGIACSDSYSGSLIVFLRTISCDAHKMEALCNIRYPVTHDGAHIVSVLAGQADGYGLQVEQTRHLLPVHVPEDHPVITRLSRAYEKMTGEKAVLLRMGAGTYARKLRNNGVAFGAGLVGGVNTNVHAADEFVFIEDMMRHAEICLQGMYELLVDEVE
ncbi:Beta-Ala-Xaa dipeptidase [compost metagenome]